MLLREEYKSSKIITSETGERVIVYYDEKGAEITREAYLPTANNFSKTTAGEIPKIKSEMDSEYNFLKARLNEMDDAYDNLMARQVELLNE